MVGIWKNEDPPLTLSLPQVTKNQPHGNFFFSRDLFADVLSVHNRNMKHACAIEFD